jgi:hypothetical protein
MSYSVVVRMEQLNFGICVNIPRYSLSRFIFILFRPIKVNMTKLDTASATGKEDM